MPDPTDPAAAHPALRQSLLSQFDNCALGTKFTLDYRDLPPEIAARADGKPADWSTHPQGRGQLTHRVLGKCLEEMAAQGEDSIDVSVAQAIVLEVLRQDDVDPADVVAVPMKHAADIYWIVTSWAHNTSFSVENLVDVENRLSSTVYYPDGKGGSVERIVTGQLDALFIEGADLDHAIVLDWKDAQPLDAKILTPRGWTTMGALRVGDTVVGSDGKPTEVTGVHPKGERLVYEVEFTDGSRTRCCDHHWWTVRRSGGKWQTKRLREIMRDDKSRWHVPAVGPVEFDRAEALPLDPYLLGALLGDGCFPSGGSVDFASADEEVIDAVRAALPEGMEIKHQQRYNWRIVALSRAAPNPLRTALADLGLMDVKASAKFVPEAYLFASAADRLELLRGLMDTDGSIDTDGRMSFASASPALADAVQFLIRSLGGFATRKTWTRDGNHDTNVVYFRLPQVPFRLPRKQERWHEPKHGMTRSIRSITPVGVEPVQCIEVAAKDMLYVTDDFIVTHNTWMLPPPKEVSFDGFFQQRFYALLVMDAYPSVQSVTLREFYVRYSSGNDGKDPVREATIWRQDLEPIREEIAALAARFDRAVATDVWKPTPGAHCLSARTRFLTDEGVRTLGDACGEQVRVLNRHGEWEEGVVMPFGHQPLLRVTFDGGEEIEATPDHRWWLEDGSRVTTVELERAPLARHAKLPELDPEGVRHGIVFGDGQLHARRNTSKVRLQPHKAELAEWFDGSVEVEHYPGQIVTHDAVKPRGDGVVDVLCQPPVYKLLPENCSPEYARGFVAGLIATDGSVGEAGDVTLSCEGRERAERIAEIARLGGAIVTSVRLASAVVPAAISGRALRRAGEGRELMVLRLKPLTAPVIRSDQQARLKATNQMRRMYRTVVSMEEIGMEEVYCVVAPKSESFTLANGIVTSNCSYCPRPTACPIFPSARMDGSIRSQDEAEVRGAQLTVAKAVVKQATAALKAWADVHGPVPIRDAKAERVWGFQKSQRVERPDQEHLAAVLRDADPGVDVEEIVAKLYRESMTTRFSDHVPKPEIEPDDGIAEKLRLSVEAARVRARE